MEQSDNEDEIRVNVSGQRDVSKCLIDCLRDLDVPLRRIEYVLSMITKNLIFDDPGLIANKVIIDKCEQQIQDSTVMWLINQVIFVANKYFNQYVFHIEFKIQINSNI